MMTDGPSEPPSDYERGVEAAAHDCLLPWPGCCGPSYCERYGRCYMSSDFDKVTIDIRKYDRLMDDRLLLNVLNKHGVRNWPGWAAALEEYRSRVAAIPTHWEGDALAPAPPCPPEVAAAIRVVAYMMEHVGWWPVVATNAGLMTYDENEYIYVETDLGRRLLARARSLP